MMMTSLAVLLSLGPVPPETPAPTSGGVQTPVAPSRFKAEPRLISPTTSLTPGRVTELGIQFKIAPGWHIYWPGQNDSGFETSIALTLPESFKAQATRWPVPVRHVAPGDVLDHVYEGEVTIIVPVQVPPEAAGTAVTLTAALEWAACADVCVFEQTTLTLTIPVARAGEAPQPSPEFGAFEISRTRLPRPIDAAKSPVEISGSQSSVTIVVPGAAEVLFYPLASGAEVADLRTAGAMKGEKLTLRLNQTEGLPAKPLRGVLEVRRTQGVPAEYYSVDRSFQ